MSAGKNMTQPHISNAPSEARFLRGAIVNGVINAFVNGGIQLYLLRGQAPIALTVDGITNNENTVFGIAVPAAVTLAMILTIISYLTLKTPKRRFVPDALWLTFKHGVFAFGLIVSGAVIWQRLMGSVIPKMENLLVQSLVMGMQHLEALQKVNFHLALYFPQVLIRDCIIT
jgi:hypothetical protein